MIRRSWKKLLSQEHAEKVVKSRKIVYTLMGTKRRAGIADRLFCRRQEKTLRSCAGDPPERIRTV